MKNIIIFIAVSAGAIYGVSLLMGNAIDKQILIDCEKFKTWQEQGIIGFRPNEETKEDCSMVGIDL